MSDQKLIIGYYRLSMEDDSEGESKGLKADITAGLSLGEYPAIAAAGGLNDMENMECCENSS